LEDIADEATGGIERVGLLQARNDQKWWKMWASTG
jgi:hypothetical protein